MVPVRRSRRSGPFVASGVEHTHGTPVRSGRAHRPGSAGRFVGELSELGHACPKAAGMAVQGGAGDEDVGTGAGGAPDRRRADTAVDLEIDPLVGLIEQAAGRRDLRFHGSDIGLTAETRVHRHHQEHVEQVDDVGHGLQRGMGVQRNRGRGAEVGDGGERAMEMATRLGVNDDHLAAGIDETRDQMIRLLDHQVGLERDLHMGAAGRDDVGAEREVRNEASIHDVELDPVDSGLLEGSALLTQPGEVSGKHGRNDEGRTRIGISCGHSLIIMPEFELQLDGVATGGACIGRGPDGRVVFVDGGLPGERVVASTRVEHARRIEADLVSVIEANPGRRPEPCAHVAEGCGGCDWQHATPETQRALRRDVVDDCLRRLAKVDDADIRLGPDLEPERYRTSVRAAVMNGRAGYRASASHRVVTVNDCLVAHPAVEEILVDGRFGDATEVTVRVGARTGDRLVIVRPSVTEIQIPDGVTAVGEDELTAGRAVHYHEEILGHRLRISARSFFQCRPDGAELLIKLVETVLAGTDGPLLDAYCGVGLFGAVLGGGRPLTGVESARSSVEDARANYGSGAEVVKANMERWRPSSMGAVIADPARSGLGKRAAERLARTGASVMALVSCDPASLARDVGLLDGHGYQLDHVTMVDLFSQTSHIETVSRFVKR